MSDDTTKPADAQPNQTADPVAQVPESWRDEFKSVIAQRDQLKAKMRAIEEAQAKADAEAMAKRGEFEKLAKQREEEVKALKAQLESTTKNFEKSQRISELKAVAKEAGVKDIEDVLKMVNVDEITDAKAAEASIDALKKAKPYLFAEKVPGIATPPVGGKNAITKADLLKDPVALSRFKRDNPSEYQRLMA